MGKQKMALKDLLNRVVAEYNRSTTIKKHRIDGARKNLLYNMLLGLNQLIKPYLLSNCWSRSRFTWFMLKGKLLAKT